MPQVFQVLKCYKCFVFQIHQTKKSNKFECKVCGEKQSIKRHYGIGTGKDCRMHVQKLNVLRGNKEIKPAESNSDEECENSGKLTLDSENCDHNPVKRSKWSAYIDKEIEIETTEEPMFLGDKEVCLEMKKKTKTSKFKNKANIDNSGEYLCSTNNSSNVELESNSRISNKNNMDNVELRIAQDNINYDDGNKIYRKRLVCENYNTKTLQGSLEKPVILQQVNKNSKWAQYVAIDDEKELHADDFLKKDPKDCVLNSDNLFSLCDDSELDLVLNI